MSAEARRSAGRPARGRGAGRLRALVASLLALGVIAPDAAAQIAPPERLGVPELERPEPPPFERPPPVLPPAPAPPPVPERPSTGLAVFVRDIRLVGNTVFTEEELDPITGRYEGRAITTEELLQLRDELTVYYVERGYINSGAVIPDQDVVGGVITVEIVEGRLDEVEITGLTWLRPGFVEGRIRLGAGSPLNVNRLQERLQLLLTDPAIERLDARLGPGLRRGESRLEVAVREARRFTADLEVSNDRSTSVGEPHGEASQSSSPSSARRRRGIRQGVKPPAVR